MPIGEITFRVFLLLCMGSVLVLVHNIGSAVACLACRIRIEKFAVFFGRPIVTIKWRLFPIAIGYIPFGGYISYDSNVFESKPLPVRWLVIASGPIATFITSCMCLRYDVAIRHFTAAFPQFIQGSLAPFEHGTPLLRSFF